MSNIKGEGLEEAQRVIRKAYYEGVSADAADLVRAYFDGEYDDDEGRDERVQEMADQHVTYTADQWTTLYASDSVGEGMGRAEELGYTQPPDEPGERYRRNGGVDQDRLVAVWAYGAYEADLRDVITNQYGVSQALVEPAMEEALDSEQRLLWLAARAFDLKDQGVHRYLLQTDDGAHAFLVGTVHPQQQGEVDLGVVLVNVVSASQHLNVGRESTRHFFNSLFNEHDQAPPELLQICQLVSDGDAGAWAPLSDMMQEVHETVLGMEPVFELTSEGNQREEMLLHQVLAEYVEGGMADDEALVAALELEVGESRPLGGGAQATSLIRRVR